MEKSIQTDKQKCKMLTQIKSLHQKEFLLPMLEGKCTLLFLEKNEKMLFTLVFFL